MLTGKEKYLFGQIDECESCPFFYENEKSPYQANYICSASPDVWHPCDNMDKFKDMTLYEVVDAVQDIQRKEEDYWSKLYREKEIKRKKNQEISEKRKQTRNRNYFINREIVNLRRIIKKREESINSLINLVNAHSLTNAMLGGKDFKNIKEIEDKDIPQVVLWKEANERDKVRLEELLKEREKRNKEFKKGENNGKL